MPREMNENLSMGSSQSNDSLNYPLIEVISFTTSQPLTIFK